MSPFCKFWCSLKEKRWISLSWCGDLTLVSNFQVSVSSWATWTQIKTLMKLNRRSPSSSQRKALKFRACDLVRPSEYLFIYLFLCQTCYVAHWGCWFDTWMKLPNFLWRKFGYVDFASEEEVQKALELNGKKLLGLPLKLDRARSKENSQENKKGNYLQLPLNVNPTMSRNDDSLSLTWTPMWKLRWSSTDLDPSLCCVLTLSLQKPTFYHFSSLRERFTHFVCKEPSVLRDARWTEGSLWPGCWY